MRSYFSLLVAACCSAAFAAAALSAADTPADPAASVPVAASLESDLDALVDRINGRLQAGASNAEQLADELKEFDRLLEKHAGADPDELARVVFMKAMLYAQVFNDHAQAEVLLQRIADEFPGTEIAAALPRMLEDIRNEAKARNAVEALIGQPAPALHFEWATREGLATLDDLKGKVVVLDFWATWCGPCVRTFPNLRELVAHYEGHPVEVVGVTSLQGAVHGLSSTPIDCEGDPAKEHALMNEYVQKKNLTWTIAFSREEVFNPDWGVRGIPYMAIVAPDGTVRHAGMHPGAPLAEKAEKIDALLREFGLSVPAAR